MRTRYNHLENPSATVLQPASTFRLLPVVMLLSAVAPAQLQSSPSPAAARQPHAAHPTRLSSTRASGSFSDPAVVYLDAAHGGPDTGTHLNSNTLEKDATLALALKLRALLTAHGFKAVMTRSNPSDDPSAGQRIDLANRSHASACLLLHASNGGHGVHLYISSLSAESQVTRTRSGGNGTIVPWDTIQKPALASSLDLESNLETALNGIQIPLVTGRASVSPIDSLVCPAVAVELAPYTPDGQAALEPSDGVYQQRVAEAIVTALVFRREHLQGSSAAHPAATKPKPAAGLSKTSITNMQPRSHVGSPGIRSLPDVTPHAIPAKPTPKPQPQGAGL